MWKIERGGSWSRVGARRAGQVVSNSIFSTRDGNYVTGELGDVGKVALLSGRPGQRRSEQSMCQGLAVG